jgi:spore germination cell wall hydrolase CwlJ-like protein
LKLNNFERIGHNVAVALVIAMLCLFLFAYLEVLQSITKPEDFSAAPVQSEQKVLTDKEKEVECSHSEVCSLLAEVAYYEARSESNKGAAATMFVVLNRVGTSNLTLKKLKKVVYKPWQFSYTHDGALAVGVQEPQQYNRMLRIAHDVLSGEVHDPTRGSTYYHTQSVKPVWRHKLNQTVVLGRHIFYKE